MVLLGFIEYKGSKTQLHLTHCPQREDSNNQNPPQPPLLFQTPISTREHLMVICSANLKIIVSALVEKASGSKSYLQMDFNVKVGAIDRTHKDPDQCTLFCSHSQESILKIRKLFSSSFIWLNDPQFRILQKKIARVEMLSSLP